MFHNMWSGRLVWSVWAPYDWAYMQQLVLFRRLDSWLLIGPHVTGPMGYQWY